MNNPVLLFDGNYLLTRAYYSGAWELSAGDELTGGCFAMLKAMHQAFDMFSPSAGILVWDGKRSPRRTELHPEYKKRPISHENPEEYFAAFEYQKKLTMEAARMLGILSVLVEKEADDVIYFLTKHFESSIVVSEDKDMFQMINDNVSVYRPMKGEYMTRNKFKEEYGFDPTNYLLYRCIVGDSSDNIKGVEGAGEKTAQAYVRALCEGIVPPASAKTRLKKIVESPAVIERNMELMDCSRENFTEELKSKIIEICESPAGVSPTTFSEFCKAKYFSTLLEPAWINPFIAAERR